MGSKISIFLLLLTLVPIPSCFTARSNGNGEFAQSPPLIDSEEEMYLLYPQLLLFQKKLDAASAYYYLGDLESSSFQCEDLIEDIQDVQATSPAPYVCEHLEILEAKTRSLLQRVTDEAMEQDWRQHITAVLDSIGRHHVVEDEIEVVLNWRTEHWIKYFQGKGSKYFRKWLVRAEQYRDIIEPILVEVGVPRDLLYLAMIESGLNLNARSRARAIGPWQFMAGTGRLFGLRTNWWIDERRDIIAATFAAAHYLKHLHNLFGSWPLALAAYNAGEYRIAHAISHQKTDNYWRLRLPTQTRWFVPKFMAALTIGRNPTAYGFQKAKASPLRFDIIRIDRSTDLRLIAKAAGCTYATIRKLNPAMKRWATPPGMIIELKVPEGTGKRVLAELAEIPPEKRVSWHRHRIRRGETLSRIAVRYEISVRELKRINGIKNAHKIREGKILLIPVKDVGAVAKAPREPTYREAPELPDKITMKKYQAPPGYNKIVYTVRDRDTLSEIAERHHVGLSKLRRWNGLRYTSMIHPGDKLVIYLPPNSGTEDYADVIELKQDGMKRIIHVVRKGETLTFISRKYRRRISDILAWNHGIKRDRLYPGDRLTIWVESDQD